MQFGDVVVSWPLLGECQKYGLSVRNLLSRADGPKGKIPEMFVTVTKEEKGAKKKRYEMVTKSLRVMLL